MQELLLKEFINFTRAMGMSQAFAVRAQKSVHYMFTFSVLAKMATLHLHMHRT